MPPNLFLTDKVDFVGDIRSPVRSGIFVTPVTTWREGGGVALKTPRPTIS